VSVLDIRTYPDEVLREKAEPVKAVDDSLRRLADDMVETMYSAPGVGLAAPQVGVSKRLVVADVRSHEGEDAPLVVLFNPEILSAEGSAEIEEGCLSLPGLLTYVKRAEKILVRGLDREGREATVEAEGLLAIVLQHEIEHLDGVLIIDKASLLKREFYKKRIKKHLSKVG
jgi:peptide deformylase